MKHLLLTLIALTLSVSVIAKNKSYKNTKTSKNAEHAYKLYNSSRKASAVLQFIEYRPITKRTYELETKRKGTTEGYKVVDNKYFKLILVIK